MSKKENRKKFSYRRLSYLLSLLLGISLLVLIIILIILFGKNKEIKNKDLKIMEYSDKQSELKYTESDVNKLISEAKQNGTLEGKEAILNQIKKKSQNKSTTLWSLLRELYPDSIVVYDSGAFNFLAINDSIEKNQLNPEAFVKDENGFISYNEGSSFSFGIDVSAHQGDIDWKQVADFGVSFAMIRAGFRGYESGKLVNDEACQKNIEGALANNINVGTYFFSQAINAEELNEEIDVLLEAMAPYNITGPVAIDIEKTDNSAGRGNQLSAEERTALAILFCERIKEAGYKPMIYGNLYSLFIMMHYEEICEYPIWYAYYNDALYFPYRLDIWQYSCTAKIPGIKGDVDVNICFQ